jgi:hypothetical protein
MGPVPLLYGLLLTQRQNKEHVQMSDKIKTDIARLVEPGELSHESLKNLIGLAERGSAKLIDWERLGVPKIDRVVATVDVPMAEVGRFVQDAFAIGGLRTHVVGFPNGIPAVEGVRVKIEASAR